MNGKDIIWSLKNVSDSIVEEAEYGAFPTITETTEQKRTAFIRVRRPLLVAAIIVTKIDNSKNKKKRKNKR